MIFDETCMLTTRTEIYLQTKENMVARPGHWSIIRKRGVSGQGLISLPLLKGLHNRRDLALRDHVTKIYIYI